jgi:hypothetical protein
MEEVLMELVVRGAEEACDGVISHSLRPISEAGCCRSRLPSSAWCRLGGRASIERPSASFRSQSKPLSTTFL